MTRTATVGIAVVQNGKILLVKHKQKARHINDVYGIPGGRINADETDIQAAIRELNEETALVTSEVDLVEYPNNIYYATIQMKYGPENFSFHVFRCLKFVGTLQSSEETEPEWVEISRLENYNLLPSIKEIAEAQL